MGLFHIVLDNILSIIGVVVKLLMLSQLPPIFALWKRRK
jgi:hypothetical protein